MSTQVFAWARIWARRAIVAATVFGVILVTSASPTLAIDNLRKYAGIVVDAKSGKVLYQSNADEARYPASITKVMTLYILFQELSAGRIKLNTRFTVSPYAASAQPTKLGLHAGSKITVENIIKSIVTISANDMARTIAENISGSESAFAKRMTATARALGMRHTAYYNASGLPDGRQRTTVRDQAILAQAIYEHFPQYYKYFQTRSFAYGKRVYGNHNRVLGYKGVDGIKTGYINAAGFNLMTATRTNNRHLVVIAFGFNSGGARDAKVRSLVATYLPKARSGGYLQAALIRKPGAKGALPDVQVAKAPTPAPAPTQEVQQVAAVVPMPVPSFRQDDPAPVAAYAEPIVPQNHMQVASVPKTGVASPEPMSLGVRPAVDAANKLGKPTANTAVNQHVDVIGNWITDTFELGAPPAPLGQTRPSAPLVPPVAVGKEGQPIDLMTSGSIGGETKIADASPQLSEPMPAALPVGWVVQIGAAPSQDGANKLLSDATSKLGSLDSYRPYVERFDKNGQTFYRARFAGFDGRNAAASLCSKLKRAKLSCLALQG